MFLMETVKIPLFIFKQRKVPIRLPQQLPHPQGFGNPSTSWFTLGQRPHHSEILVTNATGKIAFIPGFASELKYLHPANKHVPQSLIGLSFVEEENWFCH